MGKQFEANNLNFKNDLSEKIDLFKNRDQMIEEVKFKLKELKINYQ